MSPAHDSSPAVPPAGSRSVRAPDPGTVMTPALTLLFAAAAGAAVGNLYWAQPLLDFIARSLSTSSATAGWLITATQIGYTIGILLIVPLGDVVNRRRLIPTMMVCSAAALVACAIAPSFVVLLVAIIAVGLTSVAAQILAPLAGDLSTDADRGRVVGLVVSGILTGILVSRTLSGLIAGAAGWRAIYLIAAGADLIFALLLLRAIPTLAPKTRVAYPTLIASVFAVIRREPVVRWTLALGSIGFGVFTMFWTSLTFLLSASPFHYSVTVIGLFGLAGLAGALTAQRAGRLHDRGRSTPATGAACGLGVIAFIVAAVAGRSVALLLVAIVLLDIAVQGLNILNQTRLFSVSREARSRLNTAFVTGNFVGGAIGSAGASLLWSLDRWTAVTVAGAASCLLALIIWSLGRRSGLAVTPRR